MEPIFAGAFSRLEEMHQGYFDYMNGLSTEELDWSPGPEMNSLCVLGVHVTAAERFWIGIGIDEITRRNRPAESSPLYALEDLRRGFEANIAFYRAALNGRMGIAWPKWSMWLTWRPSRLVSAVMPSSGLDHQPSTWVMPA